MADLSGKIGKSHVVMTGFKTCRVIQRNELTLIYRVIFLDGQLVILSGPLVHFSGSLVYWSIRPLVHWSIGPLVHWFIGLLVHWSIGPLVHWSIGRGDSIFGKASQ